jgi:hypothetical protein
MGTIIDLKNQNHLFLHIGEGGYWYECIFIFKIEDWQKAKLLIDILKKYTNSNATKAYECLKTLSIRYLENSEEIIYVFQNQGPESITIFRDKLNTFVDDTIEYSDEELKIFDPEN